MAVSPKATRRVSWIWPCGSMKMPQKRSMRPPILKTVAVINCISILIMFRFSFDDAKIYIGKGEKQENSRLIQF